MQAADSDSMDLRQALGCTNGCRSIGKVMESLSPLDSHWGPLSVEQSGCETQLQARPHENLLDEIIDWLCAGACQDCCSTLRSSLLHHTQRLPLLCDLSRGFAPRQLSPSGLKLFGQQSTSGHGLGG